MTKEEIKRIIRYHKEILEEYKVKSIALFGSYVRNDQKEDSDIDFLIEFNQPTFRNYIGLLSELKKIFGENTDLVCKDALKERIKPYILKEAEEIK
ncbi:nucleotidyltransferase family protein [candidate division KSB1 bacterium]|nr:nucleotidyltransferase family protein [candidate division KSB1 bacterium]